MSGRSKMVIAVALASAVGLGWFLGHRSAPASPDSVSVSGQSTPAATKKILYYRNPMGLPDTSPIPKKDPMGMDYVPVYEGQDPPKRMLPGTVVLNLEKIQKIGVRTETVSLRQLPTVVRVSGTIRTDESREYSLAPRFDGWVSVLYANQTGMRVKRGQPLMAVYSPQLSAAREEYRVADRAAKKIEEQDPVSAASMRRLRDAALLRLRNWEIDDGQLSRSDRAATESDFVLKSPADAIVLEKLITQGSRFEAGATILRLADLSSVWAIAHVPSSSATGLTVGQNAIFRSVSIPGQSYVGVVEFIQPTIAAESRTVGVRIRLPNTDGNLRPGLFGDISLTTSTEGPVIAIPRSAVIDSGARSVAFVEVSDGRFEPRAVIVGKQGNDRIEIIDGLSVGEKVVVSANFLIDAESNLKSALDGFGGHQGHGSKPSQSPEKNDTPPPGDLKEPNTHDKHGEQSPPRDSRTDKGA